MPPRSRTRAASIPLVAGPDRPGRDCSALRDRGYNHSQIANKIGFSREYVWAICFLTDNGEERLLDAVERGIVPHTIAMEIAKAQHHEVQRALTEAYEQKSLPGSQVLAIRRIVDERNLIGKSVRSVGRGNRQASKPTAAALVRTYQTEVERQKLLVRKATLAQSRLLFVVNALRKLLDEEHFVTLLRAEAMSTLPLPLAERLGIAEA